MDGKVENTQHMTVCQNFFFFEIKLEKLCFAILKLWVDERRCNQYYVCETIMCLYFQHLILTPTPRKKFVEQSLWMFNISTTGPIYIMANFQKKNHNLRSRCKIPTTSWNFFLSLSHSLSHSIPSPTSTPSQLVSQSEKNFVRPKSIEYITLSDFTSYWMDGWMKEGMGVQSMLCVHHVLYLLFILFSGPKMLKSSSAGFRRQVQSLHSGWKDQVQKSYRDIF